MQLHGAWPDALVEARRACERFEKGIDPQRPAAAFYQQAEMHRLRGEFAAAEEAYRSASRWGMEPQPGLALLRMAQGRTEIAAARDPARRRRDHRPAAAGDDCCPPMSRSCWRPATSQEARAACRELRGDSRALRHRRSWRDRRARARRGRTGRRRRPGRARLAAPRLAGVAAGRGAVRGRPRACAGGTGLPRPWRRRGGRSGTRCGARRVRTAGGRAGSRPP